MIYNIFGKKVNEMRYFLIIRIFVLINIGFLYLSVWSNFLLIWIIISIIIK